MPMLALNLCTTLVLGLRGSRSTLSCSSSPSRAALICSLVEDFSRRSRADADAGKLWTGPEPTASLSPGEVICLTLTALQANDDPQPHAGCALLRRFATSDFVLAGEPVTASGARRPVQILSAFFANSQYNLLLDPTVVARFPTDMCSFEEGQAWQEVVLEAAGDGEMLAKLGWSLARDDDGCWRTSEVAWHDFRPGFRPGIGQVEWDRSFG